MIYDKSILRKMLLEKRQSNPDKDKRIYETLIQSEYYKNAENILTYVSVGAEIDTTRLIKKALSDNKNVFAPRIYNDEMKFHRIKSINELETTKIRKMNILEPRMDSPVFDFNKQEKSISITPCLAVNKERYRIGYGGGFYDRFYSENEIFSIAFCYSENIIDFTSEMHDRRVNIVMSEVNNLDG